MSRWALPLTALCFMTASNVAAQCGTQTIPGYATPSTLGIDGVRLVAKNFPPSLAGTIMNGAALWNNSACNAENGNSFPYFAASVGQETLTVTWSSGSRADGVCADFNPNTKQITVYAQRPYNGQLVACMGHNPEAIADAIAHELGHFLGLANTPTYCSREMMMSAQFYDYATGQFVRKRPSETECDTADRINSTYLERNPPVPDPFCEAYGCPQSPILIDLDGDGFHLSGLSSPVAFDINADGQIDILSWTRAGEQDAFLFLDLNGNGQVDDGSELFGNHTLLADGSVASNGYEALARWDAVSEGGNENGFLDVEDGAYGALKLWIDSDHDGRSMASEILSLEASRVERISLHCHESRGQDEHGNNFRFLARAWLSQVGGSVKAVWTADVFFQTR